MKKKILKALKKSKFGLTISDLVKITKLSRSGVRTCLAYLEGAKKVKFRNIGMAKLFEVKNV